VLALVAFAAAAAPETPNRFELVRGEAEWTFSYTWRDPGDGRQQVAFALPASSLQADVEEETWFPRRQMYEDVAKELRRYGRGLDAVDLVVAIEDGGLSVRASGAGDVRGALKGAEAVRDEAIDQWLATNAFLRMEDDSITFDHARLASEYADDLAPVAHALREGTDTDRAFVARALSFVQAIPYEARKRRGGDPGYRRPLALLARNRGDCDSKAVLFLAILRAELPDLPLAVIYVPGHALAGVGLEPVRGEKGFRHEDVDYLYVEPVGPAQQPIGVPRPEDRRAGRRGEVHAVRAG
jgi:transglutaminase-like putative cysteine protease